MTRRLISLVFLVFVVSSCSSGPREVLVGVGGSKPSSGNAPPATQPVATQISEPAQPTSAPQPQEPVQAPPLQVALPAGVVELYVEPQPRTAEQLAAADAPEFGGYPPAPQEPPLTKADGTPYEIPFGTGTMYLNTNKYPLPSPKFYSHTPDPDNGYWCPVFKGKHFIRQTQGYGTGTHYPAEVWGARDYAIDKDGDGTTEYGSSIGHPIVAPDDGYVMLNFDDGVNSGIHIWLDTYRADGTPYRFGFAHLLYRTVTHGQKVKRGDLLGYMGRTGQTTGPHLDLQVWDFAGGSGVNVDPFGLFNHICVS